MTSPPPSTLRPPPPPPTVFKLGGSLLDLPNLPERLTPLLARERRPLVVCGGGAVADAVRDWDRTFALGDEAAHRLACRATGLAARLVVELLDRAELVACRETARAVWERGGVAVLDLFTFLAAEEPHDPAPPPHTWATTGDTLAAWTARRWPADRLVLLKSCGPDAAGAVDGGFGRYSAGLEVGWVNVRGGHVTRLSKSPGEHSDSHRG